MDPLAYQNCRLCPRDCRVDRTAGPKGRCGETHACRIASYGPHFGEEPPFSGTRGSGTIFFSGCSSGCFFCQNYQISLEHEGSIYTPEQLLDIALELIQGGVHNLNFVTPDHFWPHIAGLAEELRKRGIRIPLLFNSSGYQKPEMVDEYAKWIDIFMPDFKFGDPALAQACMGDRRYPEIAIASLRKMVEHKGFLEPFDLTGQKPAQTGVLVRHLVLPGHVDNSLRVLRLLREKIGPWLPLSLMSQFHPLPRCFDRALLTRAVAADEYQPVCDEASALGFENVFVQQALIDDAFLPDFKRKKPFRGNER